MEKSCPLSVFIKKSKFKDAEKYALENGMFNELIDALSTNRNNKQAIQIIKRNKREVTEFPLLLKRLKKRYVRFVGYNFSFEQQELRLITNKQLLAFAAEDLFFKGKLNEALSLIDRHTIHDLVEKTEVREAFDTPYKYIENQYIKEDVFGELIRFYRE